MCGSCARITAEYINFLSAQRYRSINFYSNVSTCRTNILQSMGRFKRIAKIKVFSVFFSVYDISQDTQQKFMAMFTSCVLYIYRLSARLK